MYKKLEKPESAHWNSPLLHDISFIKKHLRYPVNKKTIWPILSIAGIALWIIIIFSIVVLFSYGRIKAEGITTNSITGIVIIAIILVVAGLAINARVQNLKFISIKSNFTELDNITLIRQFLTKQNLAFYHKNETPEVFQISSRILDLQYGQREIMVFIADDNRVLLNSHFTSTIGDRGIKEITTGAHKKMAEDLKKWLKENDKNYTHQFNLKKIGT
ncbi:MAG: hypothetical protein V4561_09240 [Bacteroidota bacterium]